MGSPALGCVLWCALLSGLSVPMAFAVQIGGLYQAEVPVLEQSEAEKSRALRAALRIVLTKITGSRDTLDQHTVRALLGNAEDYLAHYSWTSRPDASRTYTGAPKKLGLQALFQQEWLDQALYLRGFSVWGSERPSVLLWLLIMDGEGERILGMEEAEGYIGTLDGAIRNRGMEFTYPLLDLEDKEAVRPDDIRYRNTEQLLRASARYPANMVLYGILRKLTADLWKVDWGLLMQQQTLFWHSESEDRAIALEEGVEQFVDHVARHYAADLRIKGEDILFLTVHGIKSLNDYATLSRYLSRLNSVTVLMASDFAQDSVSFELHSTGGLTAITQAIALGNVLRVVPNSAELEYEFRGGGLR